MTVAAIEPDASTAAVLPRAGFADAFRLVIDETGLDAVAASHRVFSRTPRWIARLLALRNAIVIPLGLKSAASGLKGPGERIGIFPVVSKTPERVVMGFDDKHLDFRVVVDVAPAGEGRTSVTATTLVRERNFAGKLYLACVMPFHRLIVPAMLAQVARV